MTDSEKELSATIIYWLIVALLVVSVIAYHNFKIAPKWDKPPVYQWSEVMQFPQLQEAKVLLPSPEEWQELINYARADANMPPIEVDGEIGRKTIEAWEEIYIYQQALYNMDTNNYKPIEPNLGIARSGKR